VACPCNDAFCAAGAAERSIPRVGDGSYRLGVGDCGLCHGSARREKRELLTFKESELQPASDVVHNEYGSPSGSHVGRLCYRFYTLYLD
jgi:hypothetical protein